MYQSVAVFICTYDNLEGFHLAVIQGIYTMDNESMIGECLLSQDPYSSYNGK
jgi:hypothetical protein